MLYKYPFRILYYTKTTIQKKRPNFVSNNYPNTKIRPPFCIRNSTQNPKVRPNSDTKKQPLFCII